MDITTKTRLCGVLGNPVDHSLSPAIHNAAFQKLGLDFVYLAFKVEDLEGAVRGIRALGNLRGFSVTIPHKVAVIPLLDAVESTANHIGSVNTIVIEGGRLTGYNTDASGALRALQHAGVPLKGQHILIVGTGGAARAIAFGLAARQDIAGLILLGIDEKERVKLVEDLRAGTGVPVEHGPLSVPDLRGTIKRAQILIHATPVGMHPKVEDTCVPASLLGPPLTVMDIVYNPRVTRLLREADAAGCRTIRGLEMFLHQAVSQFELWTGQAAPVETMRAVLESRLGR
jgi:shikimate dehydrogenase